MGESGAKAWGGNMIAINIEPLVNRMNKRLGDVLRTLEHVQGEQKLINDSQELIDRAAYLSRSRLLDTLAQSYKHEIAEIGEALERVRTGQYGFCLRCHESIPWERLKVAPQSAFCSDCQNSEEVLGRRDS